MSATASNSAGTKSEAVISQSDQRDVGSWPAFLDYVISADSKLDHRDYIMVGISVSRVPDSVVFFIDDGIPSGLGVDAATCVGLYNGETCTAGCVAPFEGGPVNLTCNPLSGQLEGPVLECKEKICEDNTTLNKNTNINPPTTDPPDQYIDSQLLGGGPSSAHAAVEGRGHFNSLVPKRGLERPAPSTAAALISRLLDAATVNAEAAYATSYMGPFIYALNRLWSRLPIRARAMAMGLVAKK
ncbi:hypothetical protein AK812_SmicGene2829 [Symbiodinium microadriaticum]|uniref:Uncharacterized protein n=1 Tax=Symbiodinium microadriaticum TaxID=2951 RepID=A0A1Q9F0K2_SYMMI|nr:hypothetical protein AK812_SmicGene2829 [Symbiodinium microadriaticum]